MNRGCALALLFSIAAPAPAQDAASLDAAFERWTDAVLDAASDSRDARVLIAAAEFAGHASRQPTPAPRAAKRDALYKRALELGADDPLVWWIAATECPATPALCDLPAATARLRELQPNNAASWLLDGADADADFARAAAAVRYDTYDAEHVRAAHAAASLVQPPAMLLAKAEAEHAEHAAERVNLLMAVSTWLAKASPSLPARTRACRDAEGARRDECIALGRLLTARPAGLLAHRTGSQVLLHLLPPGRERNAVADAERRLDWQLAAQRENSNEGHFPAALRHWLQPGAHEIGVLRAALQERGIALDPPPSWRSDRSPVLPLLTD